MKKLIYLLPLVLLLSCSEDATDTLKCFHKVQDKFPNGEVYQTTEKYQFIVIDSSKSIWYVETMNLSSPDVSNMVLIKKQK